MTRDRVDELLLTTAYPESNSVRQAMLQVWNETQRDMNKYDKSRTCSSCKHYNEMSDCEKLHDWDCMSDEPCWWSPPNRDFGCRLWTKQDD